MLLVRYISQEEIIILVIFWQEKEIDPLEMELQIIMKADAEDLLKIAEDQDMKNLLVENQINTMK